MNIQTVTTAAKSEADSIKLIAAAIIDIALEHKKKAVLLVVWHLWLYSLAFHHLAELKSIMDLLPWK